MRAPSWTLLLVVLCAAPWLGCDDKTRDDEIAAQGPETDGVRTGPLHRPGQPCGICHSGTGPGKSHFSLAGTIYKTVESREPLAGIVVTVTDARGTQKSFRTNEAGNFYESVEAWAPIYPLAVSIASGEQVAAMKSFIGREASCAGCHVDPVGPSSPGHVYLLADVTDQDAGAP